MYNYNIFWVYIIIAWAKVNNLNEGTEGADASV